MKDAYRGNSLFRHVVSAMLPSCSLGSARYCRHAASCRFKGVAPASNASSARFNSRTLTRGPRDAEWGWLDRSLHQRSNHRLVEMAGGGDARDLEASRIGGNVWIEPGARRSQKVRRESSRGSPPYFETSALMRSANACDEGPRFDPDDERASYPLPAADGRPQK